MRKIIVTTYPFNEDNVNFDKLREMGYDIQFNLYKRKMSPSEVLMVMESENPDIIIAGTEKYDANLLDACKDLRMISRVGIGMDSVDSIEASKRNVIVTNTPDAPTNAVAELTICQMINCLRRVESVSQDLKRNAGWDRHIGREIENCNIGIIGCGRIGRAVIKKLKGFNPKNIYVHDIDYNKYPVEGAEVSDKEGILRDCDVISLHIPLTPHTENYITDIEFNIMKEDAVLINFARGGIVNENNLYNWLYNNTLASSAIDVFDEEPYTGELKTLDNVSLTPHLGSCTRQSRKDMENESIKNVIEYLNK
jgi:D-3-phosphoglycerate dehydrogenase